jgi:hypothetical protein
MHGIVQREALDSELVAAAEDAAVRPEAHLQQSATAALAGEASGPSAGAAPPPDVPSTNAAAKSSAQENNGKWFELKNNTSVYVTGLPDDATVEEVGEVFGRCGIIKEDADGQPRVKLYRCALCRSTSTLVRCYKHIERYSNETLEQGCLTILQALSAAIRSL